MEERKITLRGLLTVFGEKENIAIYEAYDKERKFIVNIECENARKYLSKDTLNRVVEIAEGVCSKGIKVVIKKERNYD